MELRLPEKRGERSPASPLSLDVAPVDHVLRGHVVALAPNDLIVCRVEEHEVALVVIVERGLSRLPDGQPNAFSGSPRAIFRVSRVVGHIWLL